jgi:hypothetical protein
MVADEGSWIKRENLKGVEIRFLSFEAGRRKKIIENTQSITLVLYESRLRKNAVFGGENAVLLFNNRRKYNLARTAGFTF